MADNDKNIKREAEEPKEIAPHVNKAFAISVISIFMSILLLPTLVWGVLMLVSPSTVEELTFDTGENRTMAAFPTKFDPDTITGDIEDWYNDNLPFRSVLYVTQRDMKNAIEKPYDKYIFPTLLQLLHPTEGDTPGNNDLEGSGGDPIIEETESETLPSFMAGDGDTETLPIFIEETTEEETLPVFGADDDTETLPPVVDETETETLPDFDDGDDEDGTVPEYEGNDEYENDDQRNCQHNYIDRTVTQEPSCSEYGICQYTCELCNHVIREYIAKEKHDYKVETVAPTCSEFGYDLSTCQVCGDEKKSNAVAKLAHSFTVETVKPSCDDYGYDLSTCGECGYEKKTNYVAKAHDYKVETIAPTCTEFGYDLSTCNKCGYEKKSNAVAKLAHDYDLKVIEPTCEDYGYDLEKCVNCGAERKSNAVAKLDHDWQLTSEIVATCKREGEQNYMCIRCLSPAPESVKIPKGHNGPATSTVVAPTTLDYGYTLNKCSTCGTLYRTNVVNRLTDDSYYPLRTSDNKSVIYGRGDWLFYGVEGSMIYYQATNLLTEAKMAEYTNILKELKTLCDERGVEFRIMIMPNKEQMYSEFMPNVEIKDKYKRTDRLVDYITANSDVEVVYPKKELLDAKPYYRVYKKYDTHWNDAGAFIGTQALYKSLGMEYTSLSCVPYTTTVYKSGDLISIGSIDKSLCQDDVSYAIDYKPEITVQTSSYPTSSTKSTSNSANKQNYVMLADSFRVNMAQFLQKDFAKTTVFHRDQFADVTSDVLAADVLVIAAVERYDASIFTTAQKVIDLYKSNPVD